MNISSVFATILTVAVIYFGVIQSTDRPEIFLNAHAIILVLGGTCIAALYSYSLKTFFKIFSRMAQVLYFTDKSKTHHLVQTVLQLASASKQGPAALQNVKTNHPFFSDGVEALVDKVIPLNDFRTHMLNKITITNADYQADAKVLKNIAKYPPAFGLIGAVSGMIGMMGQLSSGVDTIGVSMATALVATFWGIAFANLILLPFADYYQKIADQDLRQRSIILEGICLIKNKEPFLVVQEKMLSFVPLRDQKKLRQNNHAANGSRVSSVAA
ncbi:hypothetical protein GW916_02935 [bacterium]|nr:hypothetical protein [bacterium]